MKYEDQRSTDLAVDNLGGATVMGRMLRVDHVRYKRRDEEGEEDNIGQMLGNTAKRNTTSFTGSQRDSTSNVKEETDTEQRQPLLREEIELQELIRDHDDEDPMKEYLIQEKKEEVVRARERLQDKSRSLRKSDRTTDERSERSHRHHRHHHRHRRSEDISRSRE